MNKKQRKWRNRILVALALFAVIFATEHLLPLADMLGSEAAAVYLLFALYLVPYLIAGHDVLLRAASNIKNGQVFDENLLMAIATIGAFAMIAFPDAEPSMAEGCAVMLFYQVGELFQSYAVGKSRKSIASMMDIAPDYANIERDGELAQVDPAEVAIGDVIVVKPGERVPIDGTVIEGASQLDTAALTGESVPRHVEAGMDVISGCVNMTGLLRVRTQKPFGESTVSRILELVENAAEKKARTENFITRFARYYTPTVTGLALLLAIIPPLLGMGAWSDWILRGLTFLVVSCPCALVISVPLSFFGGIGGASKLGVLVKGSNYLEALAKVDTVVFDKTGTLTNGTFNVVAVHTEHDIDPDYLLSYAAHAESYSDHIAHDLNVAAVGLQQEVAHDVRLRSHGDAMVDVRMHGKELLQHFDEFSTCAAQRQVEQGNLHVREVVVHVMAESYLSVVLLLADHSSVFGLPHEQDFIFLCCKHHQHLGCEKTGTERILAEERERTQIGHVGVEQDEWDAFVMQRLGKLAGYIER